MNPDHGRIQAMTVGRATENADGRNQQTRNKAETLDRPYLHSDMLRPSVRKHSFRIQFSFCKIISVVVLGHENNHFRLRLKKRFL